MFIGACGGELKERNGTITSPSYPDRYPINKKCSWSIRAPPLHKIKLSFKEFELEESAPVICITSYRHFISRCFLGNISCKSLSGSMSAQCTVYIDNDANRLFIVAIKSVNKIFDWLHYIQGLITALVYKPACEF